MAKEILIVDDESDICSLISGILDDEGYETRQAQDAETALLELQKRLPSLIILDIWLEGSRMDGMEILKRVHMNYPEIPVVMISGHGNIETAVSAIRLGAYDFIEKPFKSDRLLLMIQRALEAASLRQENKELRVKAGNVGILEGESYTISQIREAIQKVASSGSRVLFTGPPGSGKEVAARYLHSKSRRAENPFVTLNCATMRPEAMEEALFGIEGEDGSPHKTGLLEQAHNGTLLFDEVADMPLETQAKIVRILQDQRFERVGGRKPVEVDVRFIASSNRDLISLMEEGKFRQDLYYRLSVVPINMPSLADRADDIPFLAKSLMKTAAKSAGLPEREFGQDALTALQTYSWPGNIRQLRNVIEWLLIMNNDLSKRKTIRAAHLPSEFGATTPVVLQMDKGQQIMSLSLRDARELFEKEYLESQIRRFGGNISKTAHFIGMERSALHRKLKTLQINSNNSNKKEGTDG